MRNNSAASAYLAKALELAEFDMRMYEVVETFDPDNRASPAAGTELNSGTFKAGENAGKWCFS